MRFTFLILLMSTSLYAGNIQKWIDEDGNVYYGDSPPLSVKTQPVRVTGVPNNPGKALPRLNISDPKSTDKSVENKEPDPSTLPTDQAKIACDQAQEDLKIIKRSNRIKLASKDGTTQYMTTEEIEERRKRAEDDVKNFCR